MENNTPHIVITGASSGIGAAAAIEFAKRGWRVTLIGRHRERLSTAIRGVPVEPGREPRALQADFARLSEVRRLAEDLAGERIDVLANNAGGVFRGSTVDGHDLTMQTNHLAPFLLTSLLLPNVGRIVNTSSAASVYGSDPTPPTRRFPSAWLAYCTSKKANIYFAAEASRRWPSVPSYAFHPGVPRTRFGTPAARLFYRFAPGLPSPAHAAGRMVWLATESPENLVNGGYYIGKKLARHPSRNEAAASRLWDATASALDLKIS